MSVVSLMPTNLYGPNDNFDLETAHVLPALIRTLPRGQGDGVGEGDDLGHRRATPGVPPRRRPRRRRPVTCLTTYDDDLHLNVGVGEDIAISDLATLVADVVGWRRAHRLRHVDARRDAAEAARRAPPARARVVAVDPAARRHRVDLLPGSSSTSAAPEEPDPDGRIHATQEATSRRPRRPRPGDARRRWSPARPLPRPRRRGAHRDRRHAGAGTKRTRPHRQRPGPADWNRPRRRLSECQRSPRGSRSRRSVRFTRSRRFLRISCCSGTYAPRRPSRGDRWLAGTARTGRMFDVDWQRTRGRRQLVRRAGDGARPRIPGRSTAPSPDRFRARTENLLRVADGVPRRHRTVGPGRPRRRHVRRCAHRLQHDDPRRRADGTTCARRS